MGYFFKNCHLKIMPLIVVYAVASYFICSNLAIDSWTMLFGVIGVYTVGYLVIAWFFLANKYEKELVLGFLSKRK